MSSNPPARRFAPTPVETSTKSSKDRKQSPGAEEKPKPRKFAVEPVSTEHKSSKDKQGSSEAEKPKSRRFAVEPVSTEQKSSKDRGKSDGSEKPAARRFAPQLESTEAKSSKGKSGSQEKGKPRRFAPQLVEESSSQQNSREGSPAGRPKFAPQLAETTYRSSRGRRDNNGEGSGPPRKFAPVLVDTASRSRRSGAAPPPSTSLNYKTESGHVLHAREHRKHLGGDQTPGGGEGDGGADINGSGGDSHLDTSAVFAAHPELRREASPMDGSTPRRYSSSHRDHSYKAPGLEPIESSESEQSSQPSSLSSSPAQDGSPLTLSDSSFNDINNHATRRRESIDAGFQQYLLQLEAKKARERLEEQALAAFPNSDFHEPVAHYVMDEESSEDMEIDDRPVTWMGYEEDVLLSMAARRESTAKVNWEQLELQKHAEQLEQERNAAATTTQKQPPRSPWWQSEANDRAQAQQELKSMRDRARPPLLGNDIVFPRSKSPEPARFDVTQGSANLRNQMCYLTEHANSHQSGDDEGLWHPPSPGNEHVMAARHKAAEARQSTNKGLWGGFCVDDGEQGRQGTLGIPQGPTGLLTPRPASPNHTDFNPFEQSFAAPGLAAPTTGIKTPDGGQDEHNAKIDGVIMGDRDLDALMAAEYPDSFITQVYNYLSLGYPTLARPFDEELAKISHIPIAELRQDDRAAKASPKGYIRLGPDFEGGGGQGLTEQDCRRWQALKRYVREWARQEKNMVKIEGPGGNWGTGARRGSWAI